MSTFLSPIQLALALCLFTPSLADQQKYELIARVEQYYNGLYSGMALTAAMEDLKRLSNDSTLSRVELIAKLKSLLPPPDTHVLHDFEFSWVIADIGIDYKVEQERSHSFSFNEQGSDQQAFVGIKKDVKTSTTSMHAGAKMKVDIYGQASVSNNLMGVFPSFEAGVRTQVSGYGGGDWSQAKISELSQEQKTQLSQLRQRIVTSSGKQRQHYAFLYFTLIFRNDSDQKLQIHLPDIGIAGVNVLATPQQRQATLSPHRILSISYRAPLDTSLSLSLIDQMSEGKVPRISIEFSGLDVFNQAQKNLATVFINRDRDFASLELLSNGQKQIFYIKPLRDDGEPTLWIDVLDSLNDHFARKVSFSAHGDSLLVYRGDSSSGEAVDYIGLFYNYMSSNVGAFSRQIHAGDRIRVYAHDREYFKLILEKMDEDWRAKRASLVACRDLYTMSKKFAEQGDAYAQVYLALYDLLDRSNYRETGEAIIWLDRAVEQNNAFAQYALGRCYYKGEGVPQDYVEAVRLYRLAADQGNAFAQCTLGVCYSKGEGVPQDHAEAVRLYRLAADQGNAFAQYNLGVSYSKGEGVPQDYAEAVRFYRLAADQGNAFAQCNLGICYDKGEGVPQDHAEAVRWVKAAAEQGDEKARKALKQLQSSES